MTGPAPATSYDLPYEFPEGDCSEIGVCTVTDGRMGRSGTTTTNLIGTAVIKPGFWGYQLIPGHYSEGFKIIDQAETYAVEMAKTWIDAESADDLTP